MQMEVEMEAKSPLRNYSSGLISQYASFRILSSISLVSEMDIYFLCSVKRIVVLCEHDIKTLFFSTSSDLILLIPLYSLFFIGSILLIALGISTFAVLKFYPVKDAA
jgi:hypothetical protein